MEYSIIAPGRKAVSRVKCIQLHNCLDCFYRTISGAQQLNSNRKLMDRRPAQSAISHTSLLPIIDVSDDLFRYSEGY